MFVPKRLFPGARVALVAPSGPVPAERLEPAVSAVRALGLEPVIYSSCTQAHGYLAGEDQLRATDLNAAFSNKAIDGILCIRDGYGAQRVIPLLDLEMIAAHPKFFCGYSDITALHILFNQTCGFATWHTPMPSTEWYKGLDDYTMESLRHALFFGPTSTALENPPECSVRTLVPGKGEGVLTGGNLSLVVPPWALPMRSTPPERFCSWKMWMKSPIVWTECSPICATAANWPGALASCWGRLPTAQLPTLPAA